MPSYEPIAAILRGLEVLRLLNEKGPMAIGDLHKASGITKPTLVRIIETLQFSGYVGESDENRRYSVSAKVLALGNGYRGQKHLMTVAEPILEGFRQKNGWPSELSIFDHDAMTILDVGRRVGGFQFFNGRPGYRLPILTTSMGKAYLAMLPDEEVNLLLERFRKYKGPDFDRARDSHEIWKLIRQIRKRGYAVSDRETLDNVRTLGVAITQGGRPIAAINVVVLTSAMTLKDLEAQMAPKLIEVAGGINRELDKY